MKQLRFSTIKPISLFFLMDIDIKPLTTPCEIGEFIVDKIRGRVAYIHGEAEEIAGFDIPKFIDGNLGQLDLPIEDQDILMMLPSGEYKCKSEYIDEPGCSDCYLITLVTEPPALEYT